MADKQLQIKISATDAASAVFRKLGGEANAAAKQIDTGAKQAGKSLDTLSDSAKKTEASTKSLGSASTFIGVGFAALGASIGLYSQKIVENEQQVTNLGRVYGEAAGQLQAFANQMQNTTIFSSEDVVRAENAFGTLKTNYGLTTDQIKQLVAASADLATANGVTLVDASTRVQAAIRGEGEAAEALGLTMNQQSIDRENLTLSMTNQQAAQFRFNALMQQSAVYQGAAAEKAETLSGRIQQIVNKFDDGARAAIGFTGPLPQIVSGLSSMGMETGLAVSGLVSLGKGFKEIISAAGGLREVIASSKALTAVVGGAGLVAAVGLAYVGSRALSDALKSDLQQAMEDSDHAAAQLNETVITMSGTFGNAALAMNLNTGKQALLDYQAAIDAAVAKQNELNNPYLPEGVPADDPRVAQAVADHQALESEVNALTTAYGDLTTAQEESGASLSALLSIYQYTGDGAQLAQQAAADLFLELAAGTKTMPEVQDGLIGIVNNLGMYDAQAQASATSSQKLASAFVEVTNAITGVVNSDASGLVAQQAVNLQKITIEILNSLNAFAGLNDETWSLTGGMEAYKAVQEDVLAILGATGDGAAEAQQALALLEMQHKSGVITADQFATRVDVIRNNLAAQSAQGELNTAIQNRLNEAMSAGEASARKAAAGISELSETGQRGSASLTTLRDVVDSNGETASRTAGQFTKLAAAIEHVTKMAEIDRGTSETVTRSYDAWRGEADALVITHDKLNASLQGGTDELAAYVDLANSAAKSIGVLSTNAQLFQAAGIKSPSLDVAVNLQGGQGAFDAVFGAIKQAQSLSQSIGGAKSWADQLIGDRGTWSDLDKLLAEHRITVDQYKAAQTAQESITRDVTNAQQDLLAVQVNLAPAMAEATRQQAEYIDSLQNLNAEQQIAALGFMDTAESSKAMQLAQLAAASSTDTMQASTTAMITEMVAADPVLKEMLISMGLISEGADGTITVNFDEANSANDALNELTKSIDALIVALGGIPPIHTESNAPSTQKDVDNLTDAINDVPTSVSTVITAVDNATGTIAAVKRDLLAIDGLTARTQIDSFMNTYQTTFVNTQYSTTPPPGGAAATGTTISPDIPRYAIGGTHGGSYAIVGDGGGPEMVWLPTGAQVTNAVATRSKRESIEARRGGDINMYGPVTLNPAGSDAYAAIQQEMMGGARR